MTASASRSPLSRRSLLAASAATGLALCESALAAPPPREKHRSRRAHHQRPRRARQPGPLDPVADLLLKNHGLAFDSAWTTGAGALERLPTVEITPHIEYDGQPHRLRGPLLATVLQAAGVDSAAAAARASGSPCRPSTATAPSCRWRRPCNGACCWPRTWTAGAWAWAAWARNGPCTTPTALPIWQASRSRNALRRRPGGCTTWGYTRSSPRAEAGFRARQGAHLKYHFAIPSGIRAWRPGTT